MREWWNRKTLEEKREAIAQRDPERVKQADRERGRNQQGRNRGRVRKPIPADEKRERQKRYRADSREKYLAHKKVKYAIDTGRLVRQPCETCGREDVHAHHDDYSKPLEVRWLCPTHHGVQHRMAA